MLSGELKRNAVKIVSNIGGVNGLGSGFVYVTQAKNNYNYVFTAKHVLQEDFNTRLDKSKIFSISIYHEKNGKFELLQHIKKDKVESIVIDFDKDFAILLIDKITDVDFHPIFVSDKVDRNVGLTTFEWTLS